MTILCIDLGTDMVPAISLAYESKLYYGLSLDQARRRLGELLEFPAQDEAEAEEAPLAE